MRQPRLGTRKMWFNGKRKQSEKRIGHGQQHTVRCATDNLRPSGKYRTQGKPCEENGEGPITEAHLEA
eukprot:scaffold88626_cov27-Tisochrysis_lutea.AAC.2